MKRSIFALTFAVTAGTALSAQDVGVTEFTLHAPHHGHDMQAAVFFPANGGETIVFAENPVFYGTALQANAEPMAGEYPLILLSHGWGGNYQRMAWLSAGLASQGAIVVSVNHPNSTTFDMTFDTAIHHWTRAQDLTTALDHVFETETFAPAIDDSRIYAAGFSYGGWTALSLGGVQGRHSGFIDYCAAVGDQSQICNLLAWKDVDIKAVSQEQYEASYKDPRVRAVAAIDPGLTWGTRPEDVADLAGPVLIVGLGDGDHRLNATDTSATGSNFEALIPGIAVETIVPATHFSALGLCKPAGAAILKAEQDDPVCTDPEGTDRAEVLETIIAAVSDHFALN